MIYFVFIKQKAVRTFICLIYHGLIGLTTIFILSILIPYCSYAQPDTTRLKYTVEMGGIAATKHTPFLLRMGQYGTVTSMSAALLRLSSRGRLTRNSSKVTVLYGVEVVGQATQNSRVIVSEGFVGLKGKIWEVWAGRRKQFYGIGDTLLSSGAYTFSTNALPIPRIHIGTPGFVSVPLTKGFVAINALIAHGWFGNQDTVTGSWLHEKVLYLRIGKPRFRVYGGMTHVVQWGGRSKYYRGDLNGADSTGRFASSFENFLPYIILAGKPDNDPSLPAIDNANAVGNQLGSIDIAFEHVGQSWSWLAYLQRPYEDKSGVAQQNWPDGVYGLRLVHLSTDHQFVKFHRLTIEYIHTMNQSGPLEDWQTTSRYSGRDDYFNHSQYKDGWVYKGDVIGTPFITSHQDIPSDRTQTYDDRRRWAVVNNRVRALYAASSGTIGPHQIELRVAVSRNFGLYRAPFLNPIWQASGMARINWLLSRWPNTQLCTALSFDSQGIFNQTVGGWLSVRKTWGH